MSWRRWRGCRRGCLKWHKLEVVVRSPSFYVVLLDEPPSIVVLLYQLNDIILLQRHLPFLSFKCELGFI
jgi:hypothetical protein